MFEKITDQRLLTIIILVFMLLQFVLAVQGRRQLDNLTAVAYRGQIVSCREPIEGHGQ